MGSEMCIRDRAHSVDTLVFDEADVGIGGAVAEIVGRLLRELAATRQVICITHLPQVASLGHQHLRVHKGTARTGEGAGEGEGDNAATQTRLHAEPLSGDARVEEIARMLAGVNITGHSRTHAQEMLASAETG